MHPSISMFPSYEFYNNLLENGVDDQERPIINGFKWPHKNLRIAIINVSGNE